jgi:hypothetical protein
MKDEANSYMSIRLRVNTLSLWYMRDSNVLRTM